MVMAIKTWCESEGRTTASDLQDYAKNAIGRDYFRIFIHAPEGMGFSQTGKILGDDSASCCRYVRGKAFEAWAQQLAT